MHYKKLSVILLSIICNSWNGLPEDVVAASSCNILENNLDRCMRVNWGLKCVLSQKL